MQDYRKLKVWQKAHNLVIHIYQSTARFPREEVFGITSQIRRASTSIAANIAEGCGRGTNADFARFVSMGLGSANEVEYFLTLSADLGFLSAALHQSLLAEIVEVRKMLYSIRRKIVDKS